MDFVATILGLLLGGGGVYLFATKSVDLGTMAEDMPIMVSSVIYGSYDWSIFVRSVVLCYGNDGCCLFYSGIECRAPAGVGCN